MASAVDILSRLATLAASALGTGITVTSEFSGKRQPLPLERIYVSFGVENTKLVSTSQKAVAGELTVEALICAPKSYSGLTMIDVMEKMMASFLEADGSGYTLKGISSTPVRHSTTFGMLMMSVHITVDFSASKA